MMVTIRVYPVFPAVGSFSPIAGLKAMKGNTPVDAFALFPPLILWGMLFSGDVLGPVSRHAPSPVRKRYGHARVMVRLFT